MKKRQRIKTKVGLALLLVAALALAIVPIRAWAQDTDTDGDGFTDDQESTDIRLMDGTLISTDPNTPDLFVILVPASPSNLPANPLEFVSKPPAEGGLGVTTHEITAAQAGPDRTVSLDSPQKAVRITEDLHPEGIILGYASQGTPNDMDDAIIFTEHIKSYVESVYDPAAVPAGLIDTYIRHTIAHEIGHMTRLSVDYNRRFNGYHYKAGSEVIMEQAVKYTDKKGVITFYISTEYAEPSIQGVVLK